MASGCAAPGPGPAGPVGPPADRSRGGVAQGGKLSWRDFLKLWTAGSEYDKGIVSTMVGLSKAELNTAAKPYVFVLGGRGSIDGKPIQ